jgi:hypothetical protein
MPTAGDLQPTTTFERQTERLEKRPLTPPSPPASLGLFKGSYRCSASSPAKAETNFNPSLRQR